MSLLEIDQTLQSAIRSHQSGQRAQAEGLYRQVLARSPNHHGALHMLGQLLLQENRPDLGIECLRRSIVLQPNNPSYHSNLGNALLSQNKLDEAAACHRRALELQPNYADAHNNLGVILNLQQKRDEAVECFRRALSLEPNYADAHNNLGHVLKSQGSLDEAAACFRRALELEPGYLEAHINMGNVLMEQQKVGDAEACFRQLLKQQPDFAEAHNNLGNALVARRALDDAEAHFDEAIRLWPLYDDANWNRALLYLRRGDFERGWVEYEWRLKSELLAPPRHSFTQLQWDGRPLQGRTILLHAEQGFGDTLHFIRYAPLVDQAGGNVIVECQPELKRLFQHALPNVQVVAYGEPLPAFDVHCPLMSLPMVFCTTLATLPRQVPYIHADAELVEKWRSRLAGETSHLKVGLAWAGSKENKNDRTRSMALKDLAPFARARHVRFYSLQKGEPAQQAFGPDAGIPLIDWTNDLRDFADTAALIANLDLVISVCTSVAHLAGAMGAPVWTLLGFSACWRWLRDRDDSPWYPTMRLFRQSAPGDWRGVVERVADTLVEFRAGRIQPSSPITK